MLTLQIQVRISSISPLIMFLLKAWRTTAFGVYGYLNFTKPAFLEHSKNFKSEDMQTQLDGKNCVVTGANSGIGYAAAEGLASRGATVYMVCRSKERGEAALSKICSATGNQNVHLEVCDLSSIKEIKSFMSKFSSKDQPIHALVNNAGLLENNRVTTSEGCDLSSQSSSVSFTSQFELNFAVNVLGTYALTELMLPLLEKAAPDARVITVTSGGMYTSQLTEDLQVTYIRKLDVYLLKTSDLWYFIKFLMQFSGSNFNGVEQYARNKRIQVALTEKWAERYKNKGVGFYSMHPGWAETPGVAKSLPSFNEKLSEKLRTSEQGADTIIWLALQPQNKLASGALYFDRAEAPKHLPFAATKGSHSLIDGVIDRLNTLSGVSA
ncbi:Short-chain dehydrogenase/reductase SDR [Dillenia turbinata]|uniref:Short-chain dehydrogenase/reductase SDR n=1 Tax=Dillenia turbinata TaxID=194707 RepID=A0AAN8VYM5_9MAGN